VALATAAVVGLPVVAADVAATVGVVAPALGVVAAVVAAAEGLADAVAAVVGAVVAATDGLAAPVGVAAVTAALVVVVGEGVVGDEHATSKSARVSGKNRVELIRISLSFRIRDEGGAITRGHGWSLGLGQLVRVLKHDGNDTATSLLPATRHL
jgi:hypothetical protein